MLLTPSRDRHLEPAGKTVLVLNDLRIEDRLTIVAIIQCALIRSIAFVLYRSVDRVPSRVAPLSRNTVPGIIISILGDDSRVFTYIYPVTE